MNFIFLLLNVVLVVAQSKQQLAINSLSSFSSPNPPSFAIPSSSKSLVVTVALCSDTASPPRFFVTNSSTVTNPGSSGGKDVFEISLGNGHGAWSGVFISGGVLAVENAGQTTFEVGLSDTTPRHEILTDTPLLGDTTSKQVLLFSPPFAPPPSFSPPTYPNYTLPPANLSLPTPPASTPNFTLILAPTSASPALTALSQTGCRLRAAKSSGTVLNETLWLRDNTGWRNQWLVDALTPHTNYTAYVVLDGTKVSGPSYFVTKSALFTCPLVASLPYCPTISYAVPLPAPPSPATFYDATSLPTNLTDPLLQYMANFTTTLLTFSCGLEVYSPLKTCADCQAAYRTWLCTVQFTRCAEPGPGAATPSAAPDASATGLSAASPAGQAPLPALALQPSSATPRNTNLPAPTAAYTALLPCLETCTAVDRACPNFLKFRCPLLRFNAAASYGVGYVDSGRDGEEGGGVVAAAADRWGNVWCNGG